MEVASSASKGVGSVGGGGVGGSGSVPKIKLRGLPYGATVSDVVNFFRGYGAIEGTVTFGLNSVPPPSPRPLTRFGLLAPLYLFNVRLTHLARKPLDISVVLFDACSRVGDAGSIAVEKRNRHQLVYNRHKERRACSRIGRSRPMGWSRGRGC